VTVHETTRSWGTRRRPRPAGRNTHPPAAVAVAAKAPASVPVSPRRPNTAASPAKSQSASWATSARPASGQWVAMGRPPRSLRAATATPARSTSAAATSPRSVTAIAAVAVEATDPAVATPPVTTMGTSSSSTRSDAPMRIAHATGRKERSPTSTPLVPASAVTTPSQPATRRSGRNGVDVESTAEQRGDDGGRSSHDEAGDGGATHDGPRVHRSAGSATTGHGEGDRRLRRTDGNGCSDHHGEEGSQGAVVIGGQRPRRDRMEAEAQRRTDP
jgi:hypothetical protein